MLIKEVDPFDFRLMNSSHFVDLKQAEERRNWLSCLDRQKINATIVRTGKHTM